MVTSDDGAEASAMQIAQARGAIYRLLAQCFYAPTQELVDELVRGPSAALLTSLLTAFQVGTLEEMLAPEKNGANGSGPSGVSMLDALKDEYMRLFEGPGHMQVAPYESVHRKDVSDMERGLVMGPATADAKRRYAEAGLALATDYHDLPDHVAVELEFMCYLCSKQVQAGDAARDTTSLQAQREFLREHLTQWLPDFCKAVVRASKVRFYRDLARVTEEYVASEAADMLET
jgi:putative dimethyl sulfoxide reductase chaperone